MANSGGGSIIIGFTEVRRQTVRAGPQSHRPDSEHLRPDQIEPGGNASVDSARGQSVELSVYPTEVGIHRPRLSNHHRTAVQPSARGVPFRQGKRSSAGHRVRPEAGCGDLSGIHAPGLGRPHQPMRRPKAGRLATALRRSSRRTDRQCTDSARRGPRSLMSGPTRCGSAPLDANSGYLEVSHQLVQPDPDKEWNQRDLLAAARAAALGWAVGIVFNEPGDAPKALADGIIEARSRRWGSQEWVDFWTLDRGGEFYYAGVFEEEVAWPHMGSREVHPDRILWFDIRIWRIAEALLHSAALYRALGVRPDQPYALNMSHHGLRERQLGSSKGSYLVFGGRFSSSDHATWQRILTQDQVKASLGELVHTIADELFVLFDFAKLPIDSALEDFLQAYKGRS